jgi:hypothetical protein
MSGNLHGLSCSGITGTVARNFLPVSNSAGLYPLCSGVERYDNKAMFGSSFFLRRDLMICTASSASPLAWGKFG